MKLGTFEVLVKSENKARLYFRKACWKNGHVFCTRCNERTIYRIAGKRYLCKRCGYTFHDFTGRWINQLNISYKQWLWIIKFFEVELSTRKIAQQVGLSYPPVLKVTTVIRLAILADAQDAEIFLTGEVEIDETYIGGQWKKVVPIVEECTQIVKSFPLPWVGRAIWFGFYRL